jgi:hypothetical protein
VNPLRVHKLDIRTEEKPKFTNIGDYLNDETIEKIANLLCEYRYLFPTTFSKMKGIDQELGEMKISLKQNVKPIRQRPYRLNLKYKEKLKVEVDRMIEVGIEPVTEFEWIISMVDQDRKTWGIIISVYLRNLNNACLHGPFLTSFTDEVLENVGGQEAYSFTGGFLGYHQINMLILRGG